MNPLLVSLLEQYSVQVRELMDLLEGKRITPAVWRDRMGDLLARYHVAALMVGMGQTAVPTEGIALLAGNIANQFNYLDNFATEVAAAEAFRAVWRSRAQMYVNSAGAEFWEGYVYRQAGRFLPLPAMPKDGTTQCLCITTPESRVTTARGDIPISQVVPGDMVLTHRLRWRRVINTYINKPTPSHRQAFIVAPNGNTIGCTTDHKWFTKNGWIDPIGTYNMSIPMYNIPHEHLRKMREEIGKSEPGDNVYSMSPGLRMREPERSSGRIVQELRIQTERAGAVGFSRGQEEEDEGTANGRGEAAQDVRRSSKRSGYKLEHKEGRPSFHFLLGKREKALHLPLPVGLDRGVRFNSGWYGSSPYRSRQDKRCAGEPGIDDQAGAQFASYGRRSHEEDGGGNREGVWNKVNLGLFDVWQDIQRLPEGWLSTPEILFTGMLPRESALYDLEVEEDHSFIVEGMVAHNSNCKCSWEISVLDANVGDFDAKWVMHPAEHCQTCIERAAQWNPLRIRDGMLMETAVKHLPGQHDQMTHGGGGSLGRFENWAAENMTSSQISHVRNGLSAMTDEQREEFFTDAMDNMRDYSNHDALREFMIKRTSIVGEDSGEERIGTLNGKAVMRVNGKFSQMPGEGDGIVVGVSGYGDRGTVAYGSAYD